ncbi:MAG: cell division ATP-binding protein FtsE [Candidatus Buchananbacteria bacterium RIFCSPHIGHO2_02_FULL_40_13]|uniref:Cell division ATP-binding protein FtsE n=1 Tax=Candidatus Buchananbacteria bacterium RIFCSPLOWO2_01_FULL_39_33 TaxID=1797543 RepID=A0A1G1YJ93_9BACT|nr:MAG: cell division ATP-binding protein FtsE [Candidatus Buchananbacteria bacterium RIFCSPHIGHO2_02_FULL_40_13]OGY51770.1 MAG: cell division ATP-binding protein FtsE [Candidatus Buchananbacteria bacterium RIFCSPLOWO2_01_FULL_39_33]
MIHLINVTKTFEPKTVALKNINLHIEPGEFISIVGQSGSGKTTIARLLIAEIRPDKGKIVVGGWNITGIKHRQIPLLRRQIGVVFQDFKLLPKKTVFENVAFALQVSGVPKSRINKIVPQVLKIVDLGDKLNRYPQQLSGGEKQRVAIARALIHRPKILLADEPTGNLDAINSKEIIDLLLKINEFGTTVVLVSHDKEIVNGLKKRVVTLENGEISQDQKVGKYVI